MSSFAAQHANRLLLSALPPPTSKGGQPSDEKQTLHAVLVTLNPPVAASSRAVQDALQTLKVIHDRTSKESFGPQAVDDEHLSLEKAVLGRIAVALYADALDTFLTEASEAEGEAEWWADIESSRWTTAWYLLQTLPLRLRNVVRETLLKLRALDVPLRPSAFTPSSLRRLFPSPDAFRPGALTTALFPHLRTHPHAFSLAAAHPALLSASGGGRRAVRAHVAYWIAALAGAVTLPLDLARQECQLKRKELQRVRDVRAEALGRVADMQRELEAAITAEAHGDDRLRHFVLSLQAVTGGRGGASDGLGVLGSLESLATATLPSHKKAHASHLRKHALLRPSWLTLLWPRLVLLPPLALYAVRSAYSSRESLAVTAEAALETIDRFWHDWLLEPLKDVVKTVRAGSDEGVIVSSKGVAADVESLERMSLALAREKLNFTVEQLAALSADIRLGDLTPVQRIYEEDIKSPLRSAVSGTLLRSVFIQVQKAKVDIDKTLSGIDKLLKSQELTFAFVGVAPALALLYVVGGFAKRALLGGSRRGRYGGAKGRAGAWSAMRRIERLLISAPRTAEGAADSATIPPLTSGLLLLSVAHLRRYAERALPAGSRLREGFLEDVADLEDAALGRPQKMRVVDRIWRTWGGALGWERVPER